MAIGVDIGATTTRAGIVKDGRVRHHLRLPTARLGGDSKSFVRALAERIRELQDQALSAAAIAPANQDRPAEPIGVAVAGLVNRQTGQVLRSVNLSFLEAFPLGNALRAELARHVRIVTDADAATWGEYEASATRAPRFAHLRLGTGIACGLVLSGALQGLDEPRTTHAPSLIADSDPDGPQCTCGLHGCLELYASGRALENAAACMDLPPTINALRTAWIEAHPQAREIAAGVCQAVWDVAGSLRRQFALDQMVLGGGALEAWPELTELICGACDAANIPHNSFLRPARLGDDAGVVGAAKLAELQQ